MKLFPNFNRHHLITHTYLYVTPHALRLLDLQLLLLCVLLLVFHCLSILANHSNRNSQTPAALDMVDGIECFPQVNENRENVVVAGTSYPVLEV